MQHDLEPDKMSDVDLVSRIFRISREAAFKALDDPQRPGMCQLKYKSFKQLTDIEGIGAQTAHKMKGAVELHLRLNQPEIIKHQIYTPDGAAKILAPYLKDHSEEHFVSMYLNRNNVVLGISDLHVGTSTATVVDIKKILRKALDYNASSMIIGHNHPSGALKPSQGDIEVTQKLKSACDTFDIDLLDHIIIPQGKGLKKYYSFSEEGMLKEPRMQYRQLKRSGMEL